MPVCDVCNNGMNWEDGYVLTTRQVPTSEAYWEHTLKGAWSSTHSMDPDGDTLAMLVQQQAGQSSGWLVCEGCSGLFSFDKAQAKGYARAQNGNPPGAGPAPAESVARAAANVWTRLYGSRPSSIQTPGTGSGPASDSGASEKTDSSCFVATVAYGGAECHQVEVLRSFRDTVLLRSARGRLLVDLYYRIGPSIAATVARSSTGKSICRVLLDRVVMPIVRRMN